MESRALHSLGKFSATKLYSQHKVSVAFTPETANHSLKPRSPLSDIVLKKYAHQSRGIEVLLTMQKGALCFRAADQLRLQGLLNPHSRLATTVWHRGAGMSKSFIVLNSEDVLFLVVDAGNCRSLRVAWSPL